MGQERTVNYEAAAPEWGSVASLLRQHGENPIIRMIDGLPAFPDEQPESDVRELRIALSGGMMTIHRQPHAVRIVTWGTGDEALNRSWNLLVWSYAQAGTGAISSGTGPRISAAEFAAMNDIL